MGGERNRRRAALSWIFVGALVILCGALAVLQYRWIGEVSAASRERLRQTLETNLRRIGQDLDREVSRAARSLSPDRAADGDAAAEQIARRYPAWLNLDRHAYLFHRIGLAIPLDDGFNVRLLGPAGFVPADWPPEWAGIRERIESIRRSGLPAIAAGPFVFELPVFGSGDRREAAWTIFELDLPYIRETVIPELIQHHLEAREYQVAVVSRSNPQMIVYESEPGRARQIVRAADGAAGVLEPFAGGNGGGVWQIHARHREGSLEAVVARARRRNLAVTAGVLVLMAATVMALIRFTRNAQRLADVQMAFVAGVSHELRTPLTVIHTAAYNLRGRVAANPEQVERYGALIQQESGRLKDMLEQVLRFAGTQAGRTVRVSEPVEVHELIQESLQASAGTLEPYTVETRIEPDLPPVCGDPIALKHAIQNLLSNAVKYGTEGSNWIGVSAGQNDGMIEIRVADRGPGIPADEQSQIFEPFFRGRRAVDDQIHGTGLGLNLVKKIAEAHGGNVRVVSEPMEGAEFILRIPAVREDES